MKRRRVIAAVVVLLTITAGAAWLVGRSGYVVRVDGGPLACPDCGAQASSIPVPLNVPVSYGLIYLRNRGSRTAVIERVRVLNARPGIEVVGTSVVRPTGRVGLLVGYPPEDPRSPLKPVEGFRVLPSGEENRVYQLVLGVRLTRYGRSSFRHVEIDYRVGRARYRAVFRDSLALCASLRERYPDCDTPPL